MDAALIRLWDRGIQFAYDGECFRDRADIPDTDILGANCNNHKDVTDEDVSLLASIAGLRSLGLARTGITDEGMRALVSLTDMEELILCKTKTTDASIPHLATMRHLQYLDVSGTGLTQDGVDKLRTILPDTEIRF